MRDKPPHVPPRRIAIIGSRNFSDLEQVRNFVRILAVKYPKAVIVSGGARGADKVAEAEARRVGLSTLVWPADWEAHGRGAGMLRNTQIIQDATHVVAFWDGVSRGTKDSIDKAVKAGKPTFVYDEKGKLTIHNFTSDKNHPLLT